MKAQKKILSDLENRIAQCTKISPELSEDSREIVRYLYSEILQGIKEGKISKKSLNARWVLFSFTFDHQKVFISTIYNYCNHIKGFELNVKPKKLVSELDSALAEVGLKVKYDPERDTLIYLPIKEEVN
jgi:hypothetical protein